MTFPALPHGHDANETRTEANFEGGRTATAAIGPQPAGGDVEHECADSTMRPFDCPGQLHAQTEYDYHDAVLSGGLPEEQFADDSYDPFDYGNGLDFVE